MILPVLYRNGAYATGLLTESKRDASQFIRFMRMQN